MESRFEVYLHAILVVDNNSWKVPPEKCNKVYQFVKRTFGKYKSKVISINGKTDHVHILFKMNPEISLDELLKRVKLSSAWSVNHELKPKKLFAWENTYYAFTISGEEIGEQKDYLESQQDIHLSVSTDEELKKLIEEYELEFDGDDLTDINEDKYN